MTLRQTLAAALAAATLCGCGGGDSAKQAAPADQAAEGPRAAADSPSARASASQRASVRSPLPSSGARGAEAVRGSVADGEEARLRDPRDRALASEASKSATTSAAAGRAEAAAEAARQTAPRGARGPAAAGVDAPVDFARLADTIRDKYALDAADDPASQLQSLLERFEQGDADAALPIGLFLAYGDASVADPARAAEFFRIASENGQPRALAELGRLSLSGRGLPADPAAAEALFAEAMAAGDPEGAFLLAAGNRLKLFPDADPAAHRALLEMAAELGHPSAASSILYLAEEGQLELSDYPQLEQWLLSAAESGDASSLRALSDYYHQTGQDDKAGLAVELAAESGSLDAVFTLLAGEKLSRYAKDPAARAAIAAAMEPHAAAGGYRAAEAHLVIALMQAIDGDAAAARATIEQASDGISDANLRVALRLLDSGEDPARAIMKAGAMSSADAYVDDLQARRQGRFDAPPAPISLADPAYPVELQADGRRGAVVLELTIDASGAVAASKVVSSDHPALSAAAQEAARGWRFEPALSGGEPTAARVRMPIQFEPPR